MKISSQPYIFLLLTSSFNLLFSDIIILPDNSDAAHACLAISDTVEYVQTICAVISVMKLLLLLLTQ